MNDDESLKLLSIFHYVGGAITGLFSLFPVIHLIMGMLMLTQPEMFLESDPDSAEMLPWVGTMFVGVGGGIMVTGLALALGMILLGRNLARTRRYRFCFVMGAIECLAMPIGTLLGVFTLVILSRPSVKAAFEAPG